MGLETALAVIGTTAAVAGAATGVAGAVTSKKPKIPKADDSQLLSPIQDTKKSPLQRGALIQTGPAGLTDEPALGRSKLLGN